MPQPHRADDPRGPFDGVRDAVDLGRVRPGDCRFDLADPAAGVVQEHGRHFNDEVGLPGLLHVPENRQGGAVKHRGPGGEPSRTAGGHGRSPVDRSATPRRVISGATFEW
jgi:hypothetical protein